MKIKYNAPTTLTFAFFCTLVVALDQSLFHGLTRAFFTVPSSAAFDLSNALNYMRLFTHIAGHADWNHLLSNMAYVLLLGPMLEETYGSLTMFLMIVVTGFVTGVLNACFFPNPLLGASGVVFMMILLASFTNHGKDDVPLTFILIVMLYLGREIIQAFKGDDISQFAHLAGGLCGSLFGFFQPSRPARKRSAGTALPPTKITVKGKPATQARAGARKTGAKAASSARQASEDTTIIDRATRKTATAKKAPSPGTRGGSDSRRKT